MEELNACTECGFTTSSIEEFTSHIEHHEEEHNRSSSGELSQTQTIEWTESDSLTPSPSDPDKNLPTTGPENNLPSEETATIQKPPVAAIKTSKTAHICPHCNFTTFMSQHMKSHLDAHERHQGQMYQCDICQMQFSQKANMHRHRMRHTGVKPYECRYCKKRFFRKDQMQEHSMTHIKTGIDFDCPVAFCTHQFSQHSTLRSHLDEAHSICAASPASCKRCSLLFANSRRLLLHYQTRHDDTERGSVTVRNESESPSKRKRPLPNSTPQSHTHLMCTKDFSPHQTDSSENVLQQTTYPITSEDLLMMCLNPSFKFSKFSNISTSSNIPIEPSVRLWTVNPIAQCNPHSPSATSSTSHIIEAENLKEALVGLFLQ
ncbi:zinc finger, C2H2 type [Dictyocaulus viviparus]|uniref:Zinc finger, C2H2 type n=1 Tax=Dictyocaulus viviparus TaxID=29172 RepID=A0A0D8X9J4_DICVI|nr:zinc finger, C2H2 type [Dictyocaulus viviparus]